MNFVKDWNSANSKHDSNQGTQTCPRSSGFHPDPSLPESDWVHHGSQSKKSAVKRNCDPSTQMKVTMKPKRSHQKHHYSLLFLISVAILGLDLGFEALHTIHP